MHVPPYYKKKSWQRLMIGAFFGAVIAYCLFMFMYGKMYEQMIEENLDLQVELSDLKKHNEALLKDNEDLDEQSKKRVTINSIETELIHAKELRLDPLIVHQLEELIKDDIGHLIGQDVAVISKSDRLLISTLENKTYNIDDFSYRLHIKKLIISQQLKITAHVKLGA
ncbi:MAG TPA: sporulation membrane protein YtrI [Bacillota bacterium]